MSARRQVLRSAALLGAVATLGTVLLAGVNELTYERIAEQERRVVLRQLSQVLPSADYDNALHEDVMLLDEPDYFRHRDPVRVYEIDGASV